MEDESHLLEPGRQDSEGELEFRMHISLMHFKRGYPTKDKQFLWAKYIFTHLMTSKKTLMKVSSHLSSFQTAFIITDDWQKSY